MNPLYIPFLKIHHASFTEPDTAEHISFIAACQEDEEKIGIENMSTTGSLEGKRDYNRENVTNRNERSRNSGSRQKNEKGVTHYKRTPVRDFDLMYKVQGNKALSSVDEYERKCERIRNYLSKLNIKMKTPKNPETNDVSFTSRPRKRIYPPLKLPSLSIFKSLNKAQAQT